MTPNDIYLVRHAQSEWNAAGRWQGQADPPLSPHGREQSSALAELFPDRPVTRVVTSDLQRAADTATPLATRFGLPLEVDRDLREIDVGTWSGRTREEIGAADPVALDLYFQGRTGWTGGETYEQHEARSARAARRLSDSDVDGTLVAVTHGGTIRALVLALLEIDPAHRWRFASIAHTSLTHLTRGAHGWRLVTFNSVLDMGNA
jgi:probable phosphoglycerate mutase